MSHPKNLAYCEMITVSESLSGYVVEVPEGTLIALPQLGSSVLLSPNDCMTFRTEVEWSHFLIVRGFIDGASSLGAWLTSRQIAYAKQHGASLRIEETQPNQENEKQKQ